MSFFWLRWLEGLLGLHLEQVLAKTCPVAEQIHPGQHSKAPPTEVPKLPSSLLYLGSAVAFLIPLKLSLSYIALFPALGVWAWTERQTLLVQLSNAPRVLQAFLMFIAVSLISSVFGLRPAESIPALASLAFFSLTVIFFFYLSRRHSALTFILAALSGQALASLHSVLEGAYPDYLSRIFLGAVTESGQLAIALIIALGLGFTLHRKEYSEESATSPSPLQRRYLLLFAFLHIFSFGSAWLFSATRRSTIIPNRVTGV